MCNSCLGISPKYFILAPQVYYWSVLYQLPLYQLWDLSQFLRSCIDRLHTSAGLSDEISHVNITMITNTDNFFWNIYWLRWNSNPRPLGGVHTDRTIKRSVAEGVPHMASVHTRNVAFKAVSAPKWSVPCRIGFWNGPSQVWTLLSEQKLQQNLIFVNDLFKSKESVAHCMSDRASFCFFDKIVL